MKLLPEQVIACRLWKTFKFVGCWFIEGIPSDVLRYVSFDGTLIGHVNLIFI